MRRGCAFLYIQRYRRAFRSFRHRSLTHRPMHLVQTAETKHASYGSRIRLPSLNGGPFPSLNGVFGLYVCPPPNLGGNLVVSSGLAFGLPPFPRVGITPDGTSPFSCFPLSGSSPTGSTPCGTCPDFPAGLFFFFFSFGFRPFGCPPPSALSTPGGEPCPPNPPRSASLSPPRLFPLGCGFGFGFGFSFGFGFALFPTRDTGCGTDDFPACRDIRFSPIGPAVASTTRTIRRTVNVFI